MENTEIICLEKILSKLTSVIQMYEFEDGNKFIKLCECAVSVSAQLNYIRNNYKPQNNSECEKNLEDEE